MVENRQDQADRPQSGAGSLWRQIRVWLRYRARRLAYGFAPLRRRIEREGLGGQQGRLHWDALLAQTNFSTYLGGTINVDGTNAMTAVLLKFHATARPSVLDIGCSGGTLLLALQDFQSYVGADISTFAIASAEALAQTRFPHRQAEIGFKAADLTEFQPSGLFDAIVFNEVLYYLKVEQAAEEVARYARSLTPGGIIVVSMKDDGKSHAILALLTQRFRWLDGILWQRKSGDPDFRIGINRENTAFLVGVFQPHGDPPDRTVR